MQYVTSEGARGICPTGFHIPTYAELQTLGTTVSNDGNALKAVGQGTGDGAGTNTSGFSALLTGALSSTRFFVGLGNSAAFWSSTSYGGNYAYLMSLYDIYSNFFFGF